MANGKGIVLLFAFRLLINSYKLHTAKHIVDVDQHLINFEEMRGFGFRLHSLNLVSPYKIRFGVPMIRCKRQ